MSITPFHTESKFCRSFNIGQGDLIVQPELTEVNLTKFYDLYKKIFSETNGYVRMNQFIPLEVYLYYGVTLCIHLRDPSETSIAEMSIRSNHMFITYGGLNNITKDE